MIRKITWEPHSEQENGKWCVRPTWSLYYLLEGEAEIQAGGRRLLLRDGSCVAIPPSFPHRLTHQERSRYYLCTFQGCFPYVSPIFLSQGTEKLRFLLKWMEEETQTRRKNGRNVLDSMYRLLFQYLLADGTVPARNRYVEKVISACCESFSDPLFHTGLIKIPLNRDYFRKLFLNQTGYTPSQFLTAKRMEHARELLAAKPVNRMSIREIAWKCGYEDAYYFSRIFKKHTGVSPKNWVPDLDEEGACPAEPLD